MIFVTVGTHEQQFNRLVSCIDELKRDGVIQEDVFIQTGFSTYEPQYCRWSKLIPYEEMVKNVEQARIVITHGGPASFIMPLQMGKVPIVVPRQLQYGEHVNDHQVEFTKALEDRYGNIIVVEHTELLEEAIHKAGNTKNCNERRNQYDGQNNALFMSSFCEIVNKMM